MSILYAVKFVVSNKAYVDLVIADNKMQAMKIIREERPNCYIDWIKEEL
ncbi:hypothetical protein P4V72_20245 [Bacillus thuringiensis]|nr:MULTISPECIES: hypothetical protein [Bacillus cereus group]MED2021994.1 hypothetical protein [Bacillus thuringiensis]MED2143498.1 hypothetical protein [Bacillus thuringiensis]MED2517790.1 hypothetical protein [Bacillus thuringiensis]